MTAASQRAEVGHGQRNLESLSARLEGTVASTDAHDLPSWLFIRRPESRSEDAVTAVTGDIREDRGVGVRTDVGEATQAGRNEYEVCLPQSLQEEGDG